ncbi:MAG: ThiF family adenylyltransferase, partial [Candidatus Desulfovibrio faecigallinarum]|nr:ThiF family adenylyltransferase [Candidatus Desulfovibrio faecigallinarum]
VTELLARLGVCHFTLCDCDEFSESNLNRQAFCTEKSIGWRKTTALALAVSDIAQYARTRSLSLSLDERTIPDFLEGADIVFDCLDDIRTKALLERACAASGIPFVHGGVSHQEGFAFATRGECGLARLYGEELPQKPKRQPVSVLAVAGTACMMVSLGLRVLFGEQTDDQQAGKLYHQDFGELAMDAFDFGA